MDQPVEDYVRELGAKAKAAGRKLAVAPTEQKNAALKAAAAALRARKDELLKANAKDVDGVRAAGKPASFVDRLELNEARVEGMATALEEIAALPDPAGRLLARFERPNGLVIDRVAAPIGVIGMIYESRPNVGADAAGLCVKSGNAVILRGGSESLHSSTIILACMAEGLRAAGLPEACVQMVETTDRGAVQALLSCTEFVDLVIPRGGKGLVALVRDQAKVPTLLHLDGNCHTYVHKDADLNKAVAVVANAKMRRTGVCGATESLVVDREAAPRFLPAALDALVGIEVRGEPEARAIDGRVVAANDMDWDTEYLDDIVSVKLVRDVEEALEHIARHSSHHTDAIITENKAVAERFLTEVDSAVVMHNASTQFSDGGEFGMGAEIGIATGKIHARGPVGLEQLTTFKYAVRGDGQIRP